MVSRRTQDEDAEPAQQPGGDQLLEREEPQRAAEHDTQPAVDEEHQLLDGARTARAAATLHDWQPLATTGTGPPPPLPMGGGMRRAGTPRRWGWSPFATPRKKLEPVFEYASYKKKNIK